MVDLVLESRPEQPRDCGSLGMIVVLFWPLLDMNLVVAVFKVVQVVIRQALCWCHSFRSPGVAFVDPLGGYHIHFN